MIRIALIALLTLGQPHIQPADSFDTVWRTIRAFEQGTPIMTATLINAPSIGSVADGTQVLTSHMTGLDTFTGAGSTWQSRANGDRYILGLANVSMVFKTRSAAEINSYTYFGAEIAITHSLVDGQTWPADDNHIAINHASNAATQFRLNTRAITGTTTGGVTPTDVRSVITGFAVMAGTKTERTAGKSALPGESIRWGWGFFHDATGYAFVTLDGQDVGHLAGIDIASLTTMENFGRFTTINNAAVVCEVDFPIIIHTDSTMLDEMTPDRSDSTLDGQKARRHDQLVMGERGPYEQTGSLTVATTRYTGSGVQPKRQRFVASGTGTATLTQRTGHAMGTLALNSAGYVSIQLPMVYAPLGGTPRIRFGETIAGDIIDLAFNGTSGTSTTRQLQIGGVATGITYNQASRYKLTITMGPTNYLILEDLTTTSTSATRLQSAIWDGPGGETPTEWNFSEITLFNAAEEVEPPQMVTDLVIVSSYVATEVTISPSINTANHTTLYTDYYPNAGSRLTVGIEGGGPLGRSGHKITQFKDACDDYTPFANMAGTRIVALETLVNDDPTDLTDELAAMKELVDECVENNMLLWFWSSMPRPAGGSNNISDAYRDNQRLYTSTIIDYMAAKGRPDLFSVSDVASEYTDQQVKDLFFIVASDDLHMAAKGDQLFIERGVLNQMSVGIAGSTESRSRDRQRPGG